jgi:hypothetical protein
MMMLAEMLSEGPSVLRSITRRGAVALAGALACVVLAGCPNRAEIRNARSSGYMTDFAKVYSEALSVLTDLYPTLTENAAAGVIRTAWHHVPISSDNSDSATQTNANTATGGTGALGNTASATGRKTYFVRFDVYVVGGKPWRVRVDGYASEWDAGAVPAPLKGAAIPSWLKGRVDALYVAIYKRLKGYAVPLEDEVAAPVEPEAPLEDLAGFGPIPEDAAEAVRAVRRAAAKRDVAALRTLIADDITWSFGAAPGADGAIAMWQADGTQLEAMVKVLDGGCRLDEAGAQVTCPPAYTESPGYLGHRAGFEKRGQAWKLTFFVSGD